jgi:hypothetical protein
MEVAPSCLAWPLEQLCLAHHCYPQLYEMCALLTAADDARCGSGGRWALLLPLLASPGPVA